LRRLVRELWRRNLTRVAPGLDVVWIAKRAAAKAGHREVARDLETVLRALVAAHA
jgi:ribonuclease P protein component